MSWSPQEHLPHEIVPHFSKCSGWSCRISCPPRHLVSSAHTRHSRRKRHSRRQAMRRHRCLSRSIWSNTVGLYETYPEVSEAKSSFVDHRLKKFGPVKCFVTSPDPFSIHREETFKFGNKQIMRVGARPNAPSLK
ncbi:unnamed protein product [Durusdinium trenchii]|uniref:Uncharacterized protein n=1 Tax=Durusdinium trenchii TaxID=1381693 RepID=A0ABP0SGF3_9DINO